VTHQLHDHVLAMGCAVERSYFATYLHWGSEAIDDTMIYGDVAIPDHLYPNFAQHFLVLDGWPTPQNDVLGVLGLPINVSLAAHD
jgi:hypothetical protein